MPDYVEITNENGFAHLTLNRPDKHNALNRDFIRELTDALASCEKDRCVLLSGQGKSFCAGADLHYMRSMKDYSFEENVEDSLELGRLFKTMALLPIPVVTVAHGAVYGGGIGLVAASDLCVASADTKFCFSEARLGLAPAVISPYIIHKMGAAKAKRFFLTAEVFDAETAFRTGLVDQVAASAEAAHSAGVQFVKQILSNAPGALAAIKKIPGLASAPSAEREAELAELIASLRVSDEGQGGIKAFFEKVPPPWVNESGETDE